MTSNYGYGYDQSNYGYQYVMPGNATGAQGTNMYQSNQAVGYGAGTQGSYYYQQQQPSSQAGYNAYSGGATPTNSTYYQQAQTSSSYRTQTQTGYPQTISYPQIGSGSYTASYQYQTPSSGTSGGFSTGYGSTFASMTPQQQQVIQQYASSTAGGAGGNVVSAANKKKPFIRKKPQDQNEYYCETCKVSCGSQLTYKTHLEGKNHKKRLQQLEYQSTQTTAESVKCEICDIVCSNKDSYVAHIKGNKHLRTINLFRRLGKPLPPMTNVHLQEGGVTHVTGPRITFIGGKKLSSTGLMLETGNSQDQPQLYPPGTPADNEVKVASVSKEGVAGTSDNAAGAGDEPNVEPVGEYLVVSIKNDPRSPLSCFHCQLCDCFFNDEFAKYMHCKGRKHRINYKKTYDPTLKVEQPKSVIKATEKRKQKMIDKRKAYNMRHKGNQRRERRGGFRGPPGFGWGTGWAPPPQWGHRGNMDPADDVLISMKDEKLYPTDAELDACVKVVQDIEKNLKMISDNILLEKSKQVSADKSLPPGSSDADFKDESLRELKGVMRIGAFAKGLLIRGKLDIELVLMCLNKPTVKLLQNITTLLHDKLFLCSETDQTYHVTADPTKSGMMIISTIKEVTVTCTVTLTSTTMRDSDEDTAADDAKVMLRSPLLDKSACLNSLASLRQTKWFQAMCQELPSFPIVMRLLLDITHRNPTWAVLDRWILTLLVQKCIVSSSPGYDTPGDIFRRVIESISSGVLLPGYPGILDPCESGPVDVSSVLTAQQRADITLSAQHYLRLIAFNQLHLVLDTSPPEGYAPYSLGKKERRISDDGNEGAWDSTATKHFKPIDS